MDLKLMPDVVLEYNGVDCNDAKRFAHLFRSTWDSLPKGVKRSLQLHWASIQRNPNVIYYPFGWTHNGNSGGRVKQSGHIIEFNSLIFSLADEPLFAVAIAHELSHALFIGLGQAQHMYMHTQADVVATELLAKELTRKMGFPQDAFNEWINCEVSTKGPYLRKERGEADGSPEEMRERWHKLECKWATHNSKYHGQPLDEVKAEFYREHSRFFDVALHWDESLNEKDILQLRAWVNRNNGN